MTQKAIWYGNGQFPQNGASGTAWPAFGFDDPESPEHGAYCFLQDDFTGSGDEEGTAYYCDPDKDLEFIGAAPAEAGGHPEARAERERIRLLALKRARLGYSLKEFAEELSRGDT